MDEDEAAEGDFGVHFILEVALTRYEYVCLLKPDEGADCLLLDLAGDERDDDVDPFGEEDGCGLASGGG